MASESAAGAAPGIGWYCGCGMGWAGPPWPWDGLITRSMVVDSPGVSGRPPSSGGSAAPDPSGIARISAVAASPVVGGSGAPVCGVARTSSPARSGWGCGGCWRYGSGCGACCCGS